MRPHALSQRCSRSAKQLLLVTVIGAFAHINWWIVWRKQYQRIPEPSEFLRPYKWFIDFNLAGAAPRSLKRLVVNRTKQDTRYRINRIEVRFRFCHLSLLAGSSHPAEIGLGISIARPQHSMIAAVINNNFTVVLSVDGIQLG